MVLITVSNKFFHNNRTKHMPTSKLFLHIPAEVGEVKLTIRVVLRFLLIFKIHMQVDLWQNL